MSLSTSRVETLADGVFAIAMTLLVLNVKVEQGLGPSGLTAAVKNLGPQVAAYAVSFLVLAVYWIGHHNQYFWIKHSDRIFLWINIFFLMCISFLPFSTSLLASYPNQILPVLIYGFNVMLAGVVLYSHWRYATGIGKLVDNQIDSRVKSITESRILLGIVFYLFAALIAFVSTKISLALFAILPFFYMPLSKLDKILKDEFHIHE